jgi:hypothetical protein
MISKKKLRSYLWHLKIHVKTITHIEERKETILINGIFTDNGVDCRIIEIDKEDLNKKEEI